MILGNVCTRRCGFCAVQKGAPLVVDYDEPRRVADAVAALGLRYAVVTSVNRDDRKDGGAELFARTIQAIRERTPGCRVEVLVPDFQGSRRAMETVLEARPDVLNHNIETVPRLYRRVRPGSRYERSLAMLSYAKDVAPGVPTKSGMMLGLGERPEEIAGVMNDLRETPRRHLHDRAVSAPLRLASADPTLLFPRGVRRVETRRSDARLCACRVRAAGPQFLPCRRGDGIGARHAYENAATAGVDTIVGLKPPGCC